MASGYLTPYGRGWLADPLFDLHREMNRLFDDASRGGGAQGGITPLPRIDIHESQGELCISADLPGLKQEDIDLRLDGDTLTLSGERKHDDSRSEQGYHVMERSYGRFRRSVQLGFTPKPGDVDAHFEHGVLTVRIPRRSEEERNRRIGIRGGSGAVPAGTGASDVDVKSAGSGSSPMTGAVGGGGAAASGASSGATAKSEKTTTGR